MKLLLTATLGATALAASASAQEAWYDPMMLLHRSYVEVEGGAAVQGRTKITIEATGLGSSSQSASQDTQAFGGALAGLRLAPGVAVEAEGFYSRDHVAYAPTNPVFGIGGATRTYGGMGNLKFSLPTPPRFTVPLGAHALPIAVSPYISPGAGYGEVQYTGRNGAFVYKDSQYGFLWQAKAGVEISTGRHVAFDIAYRYLESPEYTHPGSFNSPGYSALTRSHIQAVTLGLKYNF